MLLVNVTILDKFYDHLICDLFGMFRWSCFHFRLCSEILFPNQAKFPTMGLINDFLYYNFQASLAQLCCLH